MRLIDDAGRLWHKFWSVRLSLAAGIASAADAGWQAHATGSTPIVSLASSAISFGAAAARMIAQPRARDGSA